MGSSKYKCYVRHLSNEPFPEKIRDLEGVKNDCFPLMYPNFNVWKKVGNYSAVQDNTGNTVKHLFPTFSQTLKSGYIRGKKSFLTPS